MTLHLQSHIRYLKGVGPALEKKLESIGIERIIDLLFHLPRDYQDRTRIVPIASIQGSAFAQIEGRIQTTQIANARRRSLMVTIDDGSATMQMRLFHFNKSQQQAFSQGRLIRCFGEARYFNQGLEMIHPEYQVDPNPLMALDRKLTSIYPTTDGISQKLWRNLQEQALSIMKRDASTLDIIDMPDNLPQLQVELSEALYLLHKPDPDINVNLLHEGHHPFQQRLAFEELLAHQLSLIKFRHQRQKHRASILFGENNYSQQLLNALPFALTHAQQSVIKDIYQDLEKGTPMLRLIQGDVGSGKTIVAAMASCAAIDQGFQAALMAPTEILAEQHAKSFNAWFKPLGIEVALLLGRHTKKQKGIINEKLLSGETQLIIGTHAVIEDSVIFNKLGLIIIDEQHRFGVHQRLALKNKVAENELVPHQLIMTATPIPRTLAMTAYADLDLSVIDELPPGRKPVQTRLVDQLRREEIMQRISSVCEDGQQAYWVCTLIEESEALNCQAAEKTMESLTAALPDLTLALVHGRLKSKEKAAIMESFVSGNIDLLVATTVIEVGVNVPNASIMVIDNPERLGLSQLHQLRGRVGRGNLQSYCVLLYQTPLSYTAKSRLQVLRETNDGFIIAEKDLSIRGPGEVLGEKQTGLVNLRIADLQRDKHLLEPLQAFAKTIAGNHNVVDQLINRWLVNPEYFIDG